MTPEPTSTPCAGMMSQLAPDQSRPFRYIARAASFAAIKGANQVRCNHFSNPRLSLPKMAGHPFSSSLPAKSAWEVIECCGVLLLSQSSLPSSSPGELTAVIWIVKISCICPQSLLPRLGPVANGRPSFQIHLNDLARAVHAFCWMTATHLALTQTRISEYAAESGDRFRGIL